MRAPLLPLLKPVGWLAVAAAAVVAVVLLIQALGFRWDPFDRAGRRIEAAEARAATAEAAAAARRLEAEGAAVQALQLETHHQQALELGRATARAQTGARNANDAEYSMDPTRAARLAEHDRELCLIAPAICAAATTEPADGGGDPVPTGPAARAAEPG